MKAFKTLFYTGLFLILSPVIILFFVYLLSDVNNKDEKSIKSERVKVYDTVKVKLYDTVIIEKIKYIKKPEIITKDTTNQ